MNNKHSSASASSKDTPSQQSSSRRSQQQQQQQTSRHPHDNNLKPQRQKSTLDGTAGSSKRSSGVESDAACSAEMTSPKPIPEPEKEMEKYVALDKAFVLQDIKTPSKEAAILAWWVSPFQFYVVPKSLCQI
ncbi:hypothetical protein ACLKA6_012086 [Drosophila palustris]